MRDILNSLSRPLTPEKFLLYGMLLFPIGLMGVVGMLVWVIHFPSILATIFASIFFGGILLALIIDCIYSGR